jgi:hypothetical protein
MSSRGDLDHVADWARAAATEAEHDKVVRAFNEALRVIALCQRKLKVRQVISILSARGGVNVALLGDAGGGRNARYARIDWNSTELTVNGTVPEPTDNEQ